MTDDSHPKLPTLPPVLDDGAVAGEQAAPEPPPAVTVAAEQVVPPPRPRPVPRRPRPDEERRPGTAGHALVVCVLALALGMVLNAPGTHKNAFNQAEGWQRDVALAVTGPLADVSHALLLDRPRAAVKTVIGRSDDDVIDVEIALPEQPASPAPVAPPPTTPAPGASPAPTPAKPVKPAFSPKRKLRLWVAGDSLVVTPGWAVVRAAGSSPAIESVGGVEGRVATGLTRPDVFNWFDEIRAKLKELKPRAVVLSFGGNDDKAYMTGLPDGVEIADYGDAAWRREYARRVGGLMDAANRVGAHVVWIGLPQTRSPEQTARFDVVNAVVLKEARKREGKVTFIDTYRLFASDTGGYADYLDTPGGGSVKVRATDGVHFERAGGDMIAREVLKALNRAYDLTSWRRAR